MAYNIGPTLAVKGEKEYSSAMAKIRESMKYVKAEAAAVTSAYYNNERSINSLTDELKVLQKAWNVQQDAIDEAENALQRMRNNGVEPTSTAFKQMEANLNNAKAVLNETNREIRKNSESMEILRKETDDATQGVEGFQGAQDENKVGGYSNAINKLAEMFGIKLPAGITDGVDKLTGFDGAVDTTTSKATGGFGSIVGAIGGIDPASVGAIASVAAIGIAVTKMTVEAELEIDRLSAKIQTSLGLTEAEAADAAQSIEKIYITGAESREEAEQALTAVMKVMGESGDEAESYAEQLVNINKVWGKDFAETSRTASTLMNTFGITGQEALDLIATGLRTSADKNGDLLDVLNEYSPSFKRLGDDADTFLSRIVAGTDAGAFSADKAADVYKELFNKAADGNADFMDAVKSLGLSGKYITDGLLAGDERAQAALDTLMSRLDAVPNKTKQNQIASKLLGSQWEDVGTTAVLAMSDVTDTLVDSTGASTEAIKTMIDSTSAWWDRFWKGFKSSIGTLDLFGPIGAAIDSSIDLFNVPKYARGTSFHPGGPAIVGENGPELVNLPRGSQVIPNGQGMGGDTYNVSLVARDINQLARFSSTMKWARQRARQGAR